MMGNITNTHQPIDHNCWNNTETGPKYGPIHHNHDFIQKYIKNLKEKNNTIVGTCWGPGRLPQM
jgi:hypothetical protein